MLAVILLAGCSKDVLEENPPNILSGPTILKNYNGFEAALNGLYNLARYARWQSEKLENALNGVDNMTSNARRSDIYWMWTTSNNSSDEDLKQTWQWLFEMINASNTIIYYADKDVDWRGGSDTPENNKLRVVAEARAIRGWAYRRLAYMWGDVPLSLTLVQGIKTDWERTPVAEVRRAVISDYKFAQEYVPTEASLKGRITKGAVQTLLAEMYLTVGKPDSALYWCNQVINNGSYSLTTQRYGVLLDDPTGSAFGDMFKEGNQNYQTGNHEVLWVFQFEMFNSIDEQGHQLSRAEVGTYNSIKVKGTDGVSVAPIQYTVERGGRGKSYFAPTKWWVDSYEKTDDRAQNYILRTSFRLQTEEENNVGYIGTGKLPADIPPAGYNFGDTIWCHWDKDITSSRNKVNDWPYSRKAEGTSTVDVQEDFGWTDQIYIRLADTYLLRAEAQMKLNNLSAAMADINTIRGRSHATLVTDPNTITIDYILDERSRELFIEEERRMTLLRTHKWYERTKAHNFYGGEKITLRDTIFPIPQDVIDANLTKEFPQNPGY